MNDSTLQRHGIVPRGSAPVRAATLAALLSLALGSATTLAAMGDSAGESTGGASATMGSESSQQPSFQSVMKASNLLHKDVKNSRGDEIASVEDLAIDLKTARVDYVILSTGGVLGAGNRMIAVPPQALHMGTAGGGQGAGSTTGQSGQGAQTSSRSGGAKNQQLTIGVADNDLKSMKAVDMNQWSALSDPAFFRDTYRAAGVQVPPNAEPSGQLAQASKLLGADVKDRQGKSVGEVNDIAVDLQSASAPFSVIAYGGILGVGTKKTAVPTPALTQAQGGNEAITIAATENQIKGGKHINEDQWRSVNAQWLSNVYAQYGVTPYWQTASAAPGGTPGSAGQAGASSFAALDANGDGYISKSEAQQNQNLSQSFSTIDSNNDGRLDEGEFARFEAAPGQSSGGSSNSSAPSSSGGQQPGGSSMP